MEGEKWTAARGAIDRFLRELLDPDDEVFLMAFSDQSRRGRAWTTDRARISDALARSPAAAAARRCTTR